MRKPIRIALLLGIVAANIAFGAANLSAWSAPTWRLCECISPPSNCCTVNAESCNGCVVGGTQDEEEEEIEATTVVAD